MTRSLLTDSTLIADVTHMVRCIASDDTGSPMRGSLFPMLGRVAIDAIDSYGLVASDEDLVALVRSARYRMRIESAARRQGRHDLERRTLDAKHALYRLGRECYYRLAASVTDCRCSLHEAA